MKARLILFVCLLSCSASPEQKSDKINGLCLVAPPYEVLAEHYKPIQNVGANWVAIIPYAFCSPGQPKVTYDHPRQWRGETTQGIKEAIVLAHQHGLKVMLKPHLWVSGQGWAGDLQFEHQENLKKWQDSYTEYILHFAIVAEQLNVEMISIGTEIRQLAKAYPAFWENLILQIRNLYDGSLTYSANWDNYQNISFWKQLDFIGIDAYFPITESQTPSVEELISKSQSTKETLEAFSRKHLKKVIFTEYGFKSSDYCAAGHWKTETENKNTNFKGQANSYEALFKVYWKESWFVGGFAWKWFYKHDGAGGATDLKFTPQNKLAEKILKNQYYKY